MANDRHASQGEEPQRVMGLPVAAPFTGTSHPDVQAMGAAPPPGSLRDGRRRTIVRLCAPIRRRPARCRARATSPAAFPLRYSAGPVPWPLSCGQQRTPPTPSPGQPGRRATASPCRAAPWRPGNPAGRRGLLVPAYLRDLLVQVFQVRLHTHPAFERRQAPVQRVEPRESVIGQVGRCPAARARTRTLHVLALIPVQQLDHLLADPVQVRAQSHQHLGGHPVTLAEQPEQDVLGADVVMAELQRLTQRQRKHLLGPRRERDSARTAPAGPGR